MTIETQCRNLYASIKRLYICAFLFTLMTQSPYQEICIQRRIVFHTKHLSTCIRTRGLHPSYLLNIKYNRTIERMKEECRNLCTHSFILQIQIYDILFIYFNPVLHYSRDRVRDNHIYARRRIFFCIIINYSNQSRINLEIKLHIYCLRLI